jgi:Xaa-Pro aminopeptidase
MKAISTSAKAYLKARHKIVREAMNGLKLDALLLTTPADLTYLTDFTGEDSVGIITAKEIILVTDFRYREQAEKEAGWVKLIIREGKMSEALAQALKLGKVKRVGFEANGATFAEIHAIDKAATDPDKAKSLELVPLENVLIGIRKVKDDHEIALIRKSVEIAEEAYTAIVGLIKPGLTENYLAGQLIMELRSRGASDSSFPVIVASGANSSLPHYRPGDAVVKRDEPLLIDWGAIYRGYCSDLTRTLMIGRVSPLMKKIYNIVLEAQMAAIEFLRPGVTTREADRVARDVIEKAGYGEQFGHGLGHGIGLQIHELPALRKIGEEDELRPGMIVTVEPGIYLPGEGGVRIEDDVLITHSGREVLSNLDKSFEGCHLE